MEKVLTNSQMRAADEYTVSVSGIPSRTLMRRAGASIAEEVLRAAEERGLKSILVVCGTGNNGGDGYVCAEVLRGRGADVKVFAFDGAASEDCAGERKAYGGEYAREISADLIVDCIFGTGLSREVTGRYAEVIEKINSCGAFVVSADIPSGIGGDCGLAHGSAVKADVTVAVAEYKVGHFLGDGADYCGKVVKRDIGIDCPPCDYMCLYTETDIKRYFPARKRNTHKGSYGSACIVAGSGKYIGAAALAVEAALKSGCGYVKLVTEEKVKLALAAKFPQTLFADETDLNAQAIAIGSGCGVSEELYAQIKRLLTEYGGTLIIDADGLNALSVYGKEILKKKRCRVVLTPHVKEFSRLTGLGTNEILSDTVGLVRRFSKEYGVTLLLKGAASIICGEDGAALNARGSTALAKAGSGDMLTGYMCGSAARGLAPFDAAVCSAFVLGVAAEISSEQRTDWCATAKDIINNLPKAVKYLTSRF